MTVNHFYFGLYKIDSIFFSVIFPENFEPIVRQFIAQGLPDLSVSRSRVRIPWGIPVPGDDSQTVCIPPLCIVTSTSSFLQSSSLVVILLVHGNIIFFILSFIDKKQAVHWSIFELKIANFLFYFK